MAGKVIHRATDSAAYLNAFVKFCTSRRAYDRVNSSAGKLSFQPVGFMLIRENGVDISKSVTFTIIKTVWREKSGRKFGK